MNPKGEKSVADKKRALITAGVTQLDSLRDLKGLGEQAWEKTSCRVQLLRVALHSARAGRAPKRSFVLDF